MRVTITGSVVDETRKTHTITLLHEDIENMIKQKAKEKGIEGYEGRIWRHLDEKVVSVSVED